MSNPISILLADDHALVRKTLRRWLEDEPDMTVVADVGSADEALAQAPGAKPNVVLLDVDMPGQLCFDAARAIRKALAGVRIIFLSAFHHDRYIEQALAAGASGYITKSEPPESLIRAIRMVAAGAAYYSAEVRSRIVVDSEGARLAEERFSRASTLTRREVQVLQYIARGLSKKEIGVGLHLSERTVNCHCASLMAKLNIHDRVELTRYAIREGLIEP